MNVNVGTSGLINPKALKFYAHTFSFYFYNIYILQLVYILSTFHKAIAYI